MAAPSPTRLQLRALVGDWTLDAQASSIRLTTRIMWGLAPVKGVFREVSGVGTVAPSGEVSGSLRIGAASIDTRNARRDEHLRAADFFDAEVHPAIVFELTGAQPSGQKVVMTGTLTVRDRAVPLSFEAVVTHPRQAEVRLDAEVRVDRTELGLTWHGLGASMVNALTVHAVFTRR
jgi:polyisoprenoid-binding protein YceI